MVESCDQAIRSGEHFRRWAFVRFSVCFLAGITVILIGLQISRKSNKGGCLGSWSRSHQQGAQGQAGGGGPEGGRGVEASPSTSVAAVASGHRRGKKFGSRFLRSGCLQLHIIES